MRIVGNIAARVVPPTQYVFTGQRDSTTIYNASNIYPFESTGFGTRYTDTTTSSGAGIEDLSVASGNNAVFFTSSSTPYQNTYAFSTSSGFGTRYTNPTDIVASISANTVSLNASSSVVVFGGVSSGPPPFNAWAFSTSTGYGTKYSGYGYTSTTGEDVLEGRFRPQEDSWLAAMGSSAGNKLAVFKWNNSTGWADETRKMPATQPSGTVYRAEWSRDGSAIGAGHQNSPYISAYPWDQTTGFGTKYTDPSTLPAGLVAGVSFNVSNAAVAVSHANSPFVTAYAFSTTTGFGAKYANPTSLPSCSSSAYRVSFSKLGSEIFVALDQSPYIQVYSWDAASGFGTKFANPTSLPTANLVALTIN